MKYFIEANALRSELNIKKGRLASLKSDLQRIVRDIDEQAKQEYTEWYVLLKKDGDKWVSACYAPYEDDDGDNIPIEDFDVILPIPKPETLREFDGF